MKTSKAPRSRNYRPIDRLYNRRFFDDYLRKSSIGPLRYSHHLALVVFDLHRFKEVNDRYGHPQGDILLQWQPQLSENPCVLQTTHSVGGDEIRAFAPRNPALNKRYHEPSFARGLCGDDRTLRLAFLLGWITAWLSTGRWRTTEILIRVWPTRGCIS